MRGGGARVRAVEAPEALAEAVEALRLGRTVAMPTETVYGLAADALNPRAVAEIFSLKARPHFDPLIMHVHPAHPLDEWVEWPRWLDPIREAFWPGPLTMILKRRAPVPDLVSAGLETVGLRCPGHPSALALLEAFGGPLAAPSANRFGRISPTTAQAVAEELGAGPAVILDAGPCAVGVESTIIDLSAARSLDDPIPLLRPGGLPREALTTMGLKLTSPAREEMIGRAPGTLDSHYAPRQPLYLIEGEGRPSQPEREGDQLLSWSSLPTAHAGEVLSPSGSDQEAAARLFLLLRRLDQAGARIFAERAPAQGLGVAINDRLFRASVGVARWDGERWLLSARAQT